MGIASQKVRPLYVIVGTGALMSAAVIVLMYFRLNFTPPLPPPGADALYRQSDAPLDERVESLLAYMTTAEKVGQLVLVDKNSVQNLEDVSNYGIGAVLSGFGAKPADNSISGWRNMVAEFMSASRAGRLGIPVLYGADAIHGHSNVPGATVFPHFIGLGATGDEKLVEAVARATARELLATHVNWSYSPTLDIPRDIRWGRTYEAFSSDPALVARLGAAYVRGTQQVTEARSTATIDVASTLKHYIGVGAMQWGTASNEKYHIDQGTTEPSEQALREEFLPPFKTAVDAGARSVMVGLNSWGDTKLAAERYLITDVLKTELGFRGIAVSDWYGVYEIPGSDYAAAVTALNAGIDMVMLPFDYKPFIRNVTRAVRKGEITEARLNDAVRRILRVKFELGLFDSPSVAVSETVVGSAAHRALAREAVAKSLVLLKNRHATLPISPSVQYIQVAGSAADNVGRQSGAWTVEWQGIDGNWLPGSTSILEGIRAALPPLVRLEYDRAGNFAASRGIADIGIAVVGESPYAEGWGDREFPILSNEDLATIKKLQASSRRVVVIIVSGRPLFVSNEIDSWDAVVAAWLPGSEGAGVADVLFGSAPFTGTLPLAWPHHAEQLPLTAAGLTADGTAVLFPRYFGLR